MAPTRASLLKLASAALRSDGEVDAFSEKHFPEARRRFAKGMDRPAKLAVLVSLCDGEELLARLGETGAGDGAAAAFEAGSLGAPKARAAAWEDGSGPSSGQPGVDGTEPLLRQTLSVQVAALGADSLDVARTLNNLAMVLMREGGTGPLEEALGMLERARGIAVKHLGARHARAAMIRENIALCRRKMQGK